MWKSGCLLVFGDKYPDYAELGCLQSVFSQYKGVYEQSGNSWFVEKNGWIVATGEITRRVGDAAIVGEIDSKWPVWVSNIEAIDRTVTATSAELSMHKLGFLDGEVTKRVDKPVWTDAGVTTTTFFGVHKDISELEQGRIYHLAGVVNGKLQVVRLSPDYSNIDKTDITAAPETILKLEKAGFIQAVEFVEAEVKQLAKSITPLVKGTTAFIPQEFKQFGLNGEQLLMLSRAIAAGSNVTPLLNKNIFPTAEFLEAMKETTENLSPLLQCSADTEAMQSLAPIVRMGYNIKPYAQGEIDANYVTLQFNDIVDSLNTLEQELQGRSVPFVEVAKKINTYTDVHKYLDDSVDHLQLAISYYCDKYDLPNCKKAFREDGVLRGEQVYLRLERPAVKAELFSFFAAHNLFIDGRLWDDILTKLFDRTFFVVFNVKYGIVLSCDTGWCGRDYNSVVAYNASFGAEWRALGINEGYVSYGNFPDAWRIS